SQRKHSLTAAQLFRFIGCLHVCEFMPGGELTLDPFLSIADVCDCGKRTAEEQAQADKARLRLTRANATTLLEFNAEQVATGVVPREGCVYRIGGDERGVGVWPTQAYFPDDIDEEGDDDLTLVPFTPTEWRWFVACLRLYLAAGDYLRHRERLEAARR